MINEWGGIDKKIKKPVSYLNFLGIPTTGSCEGHVDHGSPAPWIKVTVPHEPLTSRQNTATYRRWQNKNKKLWQKASGFLNDFYKNRNVPYDARLVVETANSGFWIHNGGKDYIRWRKLVNENAKRTQKIKQKIDKKEQAYRSKKLSIYQKEFELFAKFLKKKILDNLRK